MAEPIKIYSNARFGFREDVIEAWERNNPVLERGEPSFVRDPRNPEEWLKIGDGFTPWNDLPWKKGPTGAKGAQGVSGVYVGSGEMPEGYNVQIDPDGGSVDPNGLVVDQEFDGESQNAQSGLAIAAMLAKINTRLAGLEDYNHIIEEGEANGWRYYKRRDGLAECWKSITVSATTSDTANWGALFLATISDVSAYKEELKFPFVFVKTPNCTVSEAANAYDCFIVTDSVNGVLTTESAQAITFARPSKCAEEMSITINYRAIGYVSVTKEG